MVGAGSVAGAGSSAHHFASASTNTDVSVVHQPNRSCKSNSDFDSPRSPFFERTSSSNSWRSSSNGYAKHAYSSFSRNHHDNDRDREKEGSSFGDHPWDRDSSDPSSNIFPGRIERDTLWHSHSMVSRKQSELLPRRVAVDAKSGGNGILSGGVIGSSVQKAVFDKDFSSLGTEEKQGVPEIWRVSSPTLCTTTSQGLSVGCSALIGGEGWTSALDEVPTIIGSSSIGSLTAQQTVTSNYVSATTSATSGLNMPEALAQTPSGAGFTPMVSVNVQRLEELAIKESRQLIPMSPSMPKAPPGNRRVTPTGIPLGAATADSIVENRLPNGDFFVGTFSGNVPHGSGKYLWTDGCMYEGEWKRGKASGKGKFSWPSGATYEGEFKSGRMEGFGTFVGYDGDTYRGSWIGDRKHGYGQKHYANGDFYEGSWKRNLQDGQGRYVWNNGNEYVGEWKNGVMSGKGALLWTNGNCYKGQWENGLPKGQGIFTWPDGSCYIGVWNKDLKIQQLNGTFYPGNGKEHYFKGKGPFKTDNFTITMSKMSSVDDTRGSVSEKNFPRICIWESDGEAGDITCDIIDNVEASMFYQRATGFDRHEIKQFQRNSLRFSNEVKRPGQTICRGHKNYELMVSLQLGIRYSIGKESSILRELKHSNFDPKEKFWTRFPPEGSKITPPHQSVEFRWKDYCPMVFRQLRKQFQVDPVDYMLAICGNDALRELSSPGKSGSLFYLTQDDRFMIKTVKKSEVKVLLRMLRSYYQHVSQYENSLLTKFYGLHCVKPIGGPKTRFIVMGNLFCSEYPIHRRFDLKGSSHGRTINKREEEIDETTTLKDLDLNFVFRLQQCWFQKLIKQIEQDCKFLEAEGIMDYSLLVGLHFREDNRYDEMGLSPFVLRTGKRDSYQSEKFMRGCRFLEAELQDRDRVKSGRKSLIRVGANMPARAEPMARRSDFDRYLLDGINYLIPSRCGETCDVVLYFGIIDILQDYDISKKLEHAYKSLQAKPSSISAVDPKLYSKRFRDFVGRIFIEDR